MTACCAALLVGMAAAPTVAALIGFQLLVGAAACGSQILIPLGIDLTPPARRGNTVGVLMAGLLCGILLARTAAGFVGQHAGWRTTYALSAATMVGVGVVLWAELPHRPPTLRMPYPRLLRSMLDLLATQPTLWTASVVSGLSFAGFTAFWTALSFLMADHFHRGPGDAGLFGVVGVAGALAAPLAGRLSDRGGPRLTVALSLALSAVAFAVMWRWVTIPSLAVGVLLMDMGVQSIQVAEQSLVMALVPAARSRVNTVYMVARFAGGGRRVGDRGRRLGPGRVGRRLRGVAGDDRDCHGRSLRGPNRGGCFSSHSMAAEAAIPADGLLLIRPRPVQERRQAHGGRHVGVRRLPPLAVVLVLPAAAEGFVEGD